MNGLMASMRSFIASIMMVVVFVATTALAYAPMQVSQHASFYKPANVEELAETYSNFEQIISEAASHLRSAKNSEITDSDDVDCASGQYVCFELINESSTGGTSVGIVFNFLLLSLQLYVEQFCKSARQALAEFNAELISLLYSDTALSTFSRADVLASEWSVTVILPKFVELIVVRRIGSSTAYA